MQKKIIWISPLLGLCSICFADPSKAKIISQKNSQCRIESSAGEYPAYKVLKGTKVIFAPSSDGIVNALISPDGQYVALAAGEIDLIEGFGVMIINCGSKQKKGFWTGKPTFLKEWKKQKLILNNGEINFAGKNFETLP